MLTVREVLAFALAAFAIIVVPGPSVLFVISRGVALGRRAALATVLGNALGALVMAILVSVGLSAVVTRSAVIFTAVKWVGAAYLVYLGVQAFRHRKALAGTMTNTLVEPRSDWRIIREGFVVGITNPKVLVFFGATLPQFVHPERGNTVQQMILLGLVFEVIALVSDGAWGLLAGSVRTWFAASPKRLEAVGGLGGLAIAGLGIRLALTGRKD
jgi:threonine/homoserine/homoserine lactone efflux protein